MPDMLLLLAQVAVVLVAARGVGLLCRRIHQPQVVGEMVAGILLGPSLLGWVWPEASARLFPPESLGFLGSLSQVGLVVFMFLVGLELNLRLLRERGRTAVAASVASIAAPMLLGAVLAALVYPRLAPAGVPFPAFALFMGAAMSVTAFAVLARILEERGLTGTRLGAVSLACAAVGDAVAWCLLAAVAVLAHADAEGLPLWAMLGGSAAFVLIAVLAVRPLLAGLEGAVRRRGTLSQDLLALALLVALAFAWTTEWLGIHAVFGAFVAGAVMPGGGAFAAAVREKVSDFAVVLLLPIFFAFTGLRTDIGLVSGAQMWMWCALILLVAVGGKFGGCIVAARLTGMPWRESAALGVLMNTRGLMELVILSVGLEAGIISPPLFAMMVLMAVLTTLMTTPLLHWIQPPAPRTDAVPVSLPADARPGKLRRRAGVPAGTGAAGEAW
ncbi:MAG TPA: cation:proton antiporter [Longimicrobium sp.]|nr:cation:proton antiporter [Longimicrobium sp.]